jgi:HK97 family phage major capsid protein
MNIWLGHADAMARATERHLRAGRWFRATIFGDERAIDWCGRTKGFALVRAGSTGSNVAGGFLVPDEIEKDIIAQRAMAGVFRREADVRTMGSDVRHVPKRVSGVSMAFIAEGVRAAETEAVFGEVSLTTKKAGGYSRISSELEEDEDADLGRFLVEDFGSSLAALEDSCGFVGDGTSPFGGMVGICKHLIDGQHNAGKVTAASGHDTVPEIDAVDLANLMGALPARYWPNAKWYASSYFIGNVLARIGMQTGGIIETVNGPRAQFYYSGFPVVPVESMPATSGSMTGTVMLTFGDLRQSSTMGARRGLTVRRSTNAYFAQDQIAVLATQRFDLVNHSLGDNSTAGAMVGLVGA